MKKLTLFYFSSWRENVYHLRLEEVEQKVPYYQFALYTENPQYSCLKKKNQSNFKNMHASVVLMRELWPLKRCSRYLSWGIFSFMNCNSKT